MKCWHVDYKKHKWPSVFVQASNLKMNSNILSESEYSQIHPHLPPMQRESIPVLKYSTSVHGISINTLFSNVSSSGPLLLLLKTPQRRLGAFLSQSLEQTKGYYGNGSCFLFTLQPLALFKSTGRNNYYILSEEGAKIAIGGGGLGFGLWFEFVFKAGLTKDC